MMSELERDYTLDVPEESNLQQALDKRLGPSRLAVGDVLQNASLNDLLGVLQAAWLHDAAVQVKDLGAIPTNTLGVDLSQLRSITEVDTISGLCTVERCATPASIATALESEGLWLDSGHFSDQESPIGPAAEAGEAGVLIASISAALADGTHFSTPLAPRRATGPNPDYILIGSEGRTGVITHLTLRVRRIPDWSRAIQIDGPTVGLIEATRKTLRTYRPSYAWLERPARGKVRLFMIPGVLPVPMHEFQSFNTTPPTAKESQPSPPKAQPKRIGWRALTEQFKKTKCWAGPLDAHGGWVRGPQWPNAQDEATLEHVRQSLDPAEVLR